MKLADMVGDFFAGCDNFYVKRILRGISLFIMAHTCALLLPIAFTGSLLVGLVRGSERFVTMSAAASLTISVGLVWLGVLYLTAPHPVFEVTSERRDKFRKARVFARRAAHLWFIAGLLLVVFALMSRTVAFSSMICTLVCGVLFGWTSLGYFRVIADCCADVGVAKAVRRMGRLAPIILIGPPVTVAAMLAVASLGMGRIATEVWVGSICCVPLAYLVAWALTMGMLSEVSQLLRKQAKVE